MIKGLTVKVKRINTKQLAIELNRNWFEFDCLRQTTIIAILEDLLALGLNKEQAITALYTRYINPVISRMIDDK